MTWTSSDPAVASVDAQGRVTALAAGSTTIRAQAGSQSAAAAVRVHAAGAATAGALIATALAQGTISAEQALIYRVYARFGDSRLPAALEGAPATTSSHGLMREVAGAMSTLSPAAQDILQPFLLPPIYAESWAAQQMGLTAATGSALSAQGAKRPLATTVNCRVANFPTGWRQLTTAHFNIHYPVVMGGDPSAVNIAQALAAVVEQAYGSVTGLLQRFPMTDGGLPCNGGDGALDIYIDYFMPAADLAGTTTYNGCNAVPSYISINSSHPFFRGEVAQRPTDPNVQRAAKAVLAHEITHVIQFAMTRAAACNDYEWLDEATATWAMDYVDPTLDRMEDGWTKITAVRQRTGGYLLRYLGADHRRTLEVPGADEGPHQHGYAEYLFFQFAARRFGSDVIKRVFDAQVGQASVEAVQSALAPQGGFKAVWPEFAQTLWNGRAEQVLDYWSTTDRYDYGLADIYQPLAGDNFAAGLPRLKTRKVDQQGRPRATFELLEHALAFPGTYYEIDPRSLYVEHLKFDDASVRSVMLVNPIAILPNHDNMKLQAVKKIGGVWQAVEDWTEDSTRSFCLDKRSERLEELILIVSNSEVNRGGEQPFRIPQTFPMRLSTSNVGCWQWTGTSTTTTTYDDGILSGSSTGSGVVRWEVTAALPGSLQLAPLAGFIDGSSSGRLGGCTFTETADRLVLSATGSDAGKLYLNLDLELGIGDPPDRKLTAFDGLAPMVATRTLVCPNVTTGSTGPTIYTWLQVDSDLSYAVSADGSTLQGQYIANFPATRSSISTVFSFTAQRE